MSGIILVNDDGTQSNLYDPLMTAISPTDYSSCSWIPKGASPLLGAGQYIDALRVSNLDISNQLFSRTLNIGPSQIAKARCGQLARSTV